MSQLVKYKYDSCHYDKRIQPNRIYEVEKETLKNGFRNYAIRGLSGWFDARCFVLVKPYMALARTGPVVGKSMACCRFEACKGDEPGFAGWRIERCTTDIVASFYRCGEDTYVVFTQNDVYIVQISG